MTRILRLAYFVKKYFKMQGKRVIVAGRDELLKFFWFGSFVL